MIGTNSLLTNEIVSGVFGGPQGSQHTSHEAN